jgi:hypothetical protein
MKAAPIPIRLVLEDLHQGVHLDPGLAERILMTMAGCAP